MADNAEEKIPEKPVVFAFAIREARDSQGNLIGYRVQSKNEGVADEFVITMMRTWLRAEEDSYHERFLNKH